MTREARALFLSLLTLVVYATSIYISLGSFIFPFPLNEFIFLAVALQFFWWNRRGNKFAGILASSAGICAVLSTQFFWTFIYGPEGMMDFTEGLTIDYFLIGFYLLILIGGIATLLKQLLFLESEHKNKKTIPLLLSALFVVAFVSGVFLNHPLLLLLSYGFMTASTQLSKVFVPYHLLWILLFVLKLTEWLTFFLLS